MRKVFFYFDYNSRYGMGHYNRCKVIAENCHSGTLIINESTSYPGTLRNVIVPTVEKAGKKEFMFASAPEA